MMTVTRESGLSIASFDTGDSIVFLSAAGDVLHCSTEDVEMWRRDFSGPLSETLARLGYSPTEVFCLPVA